MEREMRQLLAAVGLMATGTHCHKEAQSIVECLEQEEGTEEVVAMILAMSFMNRGKYEQAEQHLASLCSAHASLIPLAALAAGKAGLSSKAEHWLQQAANGRPQSKAFAESFSHDLRNFG
ncbi:YscG family type III secretion system chaperone [Vibrio europaeus]|uniref:YscG family type III secretion system chaperone n=1 Tax=Vibrio europaeus TaxID=300876 RepID=UPI00233E8F21|nr:YscG family type III secretion system chaperone [Vibrio europaeus]MDC5821461.1 YscG family type III secretion system chaperone [Vibrio europaeus]MDC5868459.1 YscG family type III secretion system chaperone [Vibrio europaeus]